MADKKEWTYDEDAQSRVRIELEAVDIMCSKTSEPHRDWREGIRADTKAGAR